MVKRIFKKINGESSVKSASVLLAATLLLSNILGMLRDHFLAQRVPTSMLDVYYAAFRIPDTVFNLLILGAIASAFIPVFSGFLATGDKKTAWRLASNVFNIAFLTLSLACLLIYLLMPVLTPIVVPKFDPQRLEMTIRLSRLMLLTPVIFGLSYILGGMLNSAKHFVSYSLAPLFYNLAIIFGAVILAPKYGIMGVGISVVVGAFLHFLIQLPAVLRLGFKWSLVCDFKDEAMKKIVKLMAWRTLSLSSQQLTLIIFTAIGSALAAGSIAIFNLANNIQTLPTVVFGTSFATALFPTLTEQIATGKRDEFLHHLTKTLRMIFFLMIPSTVTLIALRSQTIRLILGSGYFNWGDTIAAANTLAWFAISLITQGPINLLARAFYALHDTKTPAKWSLSFFLTAAVLGIPLSKTMGVEGMALAFSLGSLINFLGLYFALGHHHEIYFNHKAITNSLIKAALAGLVMALVMWLVKYAIVPYINMRTTVGILTQFLVAGILGALIYLAVAWLMNMEELKWLWEFRKRNE